MAFSIGIFQIKFGIAVSGIQTLLAGTLFRQMAINRLSTPRSPLPVSNAVKALSILHQLIFHSVTNPVEYDLNFFYLAFLPSSPSP